MSTDLPSDDDKTGFSEFLTDYFVECDEHLSIARRSLLELEPLLRQAKLDSALLDELFRSFHSLKGLSAMVGFHEAEHLAHHLETFLGAVRKNQARFDLEGLEGLMEAVVMLEQIIAARRDGSPPPDVSGLLNRLALLLPISPNKPAQTAAIAKPSGDKEAQLLEKIRRGGHASQITFTPSAELNARGIDVNSIRQKLQAVGEIVQSTPVVGEEGRIAFSFLLVSQKPLDELSGLTGDGLSYRPYQVPTTPDQGTAEALTVSSHTAGPSTHLTPANIVRVDLQRLDELMRLVGELVLSRARLDDGLRRIDALVPAASMRQLRETTSAIERQIRDLREGVMRVRMVPIREVFARMQFVVRDLTREMGKSVAIHFTGKETQIDKYVVERIMDPLLHLVRNAVSHGIESREERLAQGKGAEGQLALRAKTTGQTVIIEVEDDGRGIDAERVFARARARGISVEGPSTGVADVLDVLCIPGFSTQENPDRASGRGVGMDVVRNAVEAMGGSVVLHTTVGKGTRFEIQLPLTLAITDALIVKVGVERYAIPQVAVREIIRIEKGTSTILEKNELLKYRSGALPLLRLSQLFGVMIAEDQHFYALVIGEGSQAVAIAVERMLGLREIVVRPLTDRLVQVPHVAGATELGDGRVVLILDANSLARGVRRKTGMQTTSSTRSAAAKVRLQGEHDHVN